jgi:hypothetical protein
VVSDAPQLFREYLGQNGLVLEEMTPRQGVDAVLGFFKKQRFGFDGSDWVLFQCGTHDWGNGKHFEFNLTRQLAVNQTDEYIARMERAAQEPSNQDDHGHDDGGGIWQLSLTFKFAPTPENRDFHGAGQWCESHSDAAIADFRTYIEQTAAFSLADARADVIELVYEDVC